MNIAGLSGRIYSCQFLNILVL